MDSSITTIAEIADVFDGPHATPEKTESGPYFLSISSLEKGRLYLPKSAHLSETDYQKWTKRVTPQKGDLLFSYETRLGEAALMPEGIKACLGRRMGLLRPKIDRVLPEYLLYAYLSPAFQQTIISNTIRGATVDRIALNELPDFCIRVPSMQEQIKVATLLKVLDTKIDSNNRINAELEAMAKTLYDYWFVQFDFPDQQGRPYKTSGGSMTYNPTLKREIPSGWKTEPLLESCQVTDCLHSKKPVYLFESEDNYLLQLNNILDNGQIDLSNKYFVSKVDYKIWTSRIEVKEHDVVMTNAGRVAAFAQIPAHVVCGIGRNITAIRPQSIHPNFFFLCLSSPNIQSQILANLDQGAFFKSFNVKGIKLLNLLRPRPDLERAFEEKVTPIIKRRHELVSENSLLIQLRDWLLPMLMNGQVTVM